jgi:cell division protease FtsH
MSSSEKEPNKPNMPQGFRWQPLIWILLAVGIAVYWASTFHHHGKTQELSFSEFVQDVKQDKVAAVTVNGQDISGKFKKSAQNSNKNSNSNGNGNGNGNSSSNANAGHNNQSIRQRLDQNDADSQQQSRQFKTTRPPFGGTNLLNLLQKHNVQITAKSAGTALWKRLLVGILPWILILGIGFFIFRRMQQRMGGGGQGGGAFGMGKSKAKRFREGKTGVTMQDVAGVDQAKRDLVEIIDYLKEPQRFQALGAKIPRGVLMMGSPGVGKTMLAKAVAGEADVPFYSISGSEFIEMFVGVGAARVRDMFNSAKQEAPALIFIDELDAIGRARGSGMGGGHDEREQTLNQILSEMDGFNTYETVVVLAATNRPDVLDQALIRPGRFDRKVALERPSRKAREAILRVHARNKPLAEDVDLAALADRTAGFSGAELENLLNEGALLAGRDRVQRIDMATLNQARDHLVFGGERDTGLSEQEKRIVAYHESGHALMAYLLPRAEAPDKITIIPRGRALGATEQIPDEERYNMSISYLYDRIGVMLGGHISEQLVFGEVTTGAEQDLKQVSQIARHMIANWGMNERLGPIAFSQEQSPMGTPSRDFSEHTAYDIDAEMRELVSSISEQVYNTLNENRAKLDALARELLEHETLESNAIRRAVETGTTETDSKGTNVLAIQDKVLASKAPDETSPDETSTAPPQR